MAAGAWHPDPYGGASWRLWDGSRWGGETAGAFPNAPWPPLRDSVGHRLVLEGAPQSSDGELSLGPAQVAAIRKPGFSGSGGADCCEGSWEFVREGLASERFVILSLPARAEIARFRWGGGGALSPEGLNGMLEFPDGRRFPMLKTVEVHGRDAGLIGGMTKLGDDDWTMVSPANVPLVRVDFVLGGWRGIRDVGAGVINTDVYPAAADAIELPLLVLVANYMAWAVTKAREGPGRLRERAT